MLLSHFVLSVLPCGLERYQSAWKFVRNVVSLIPAIDRELVFKEIEANSHHLKEVEHEDFKTL